MNGRARLIHQRQCFGPGREDGGTGRARSEQGLLVCLQDKIQKPPGFGLLAGKVFQIVQVDRLCDVARNDSRRARNQPRVTFRDGCYGGRVLSGRDGLVPLDAGEYGISLPILIQSKPTGNVAVLNGFLEVTGQVMVYRECRECWGLPGDTALNKF